MRKFEWLKVFFSPFKRLKVKFYIGKIIYGTPYFYPRKWVKNKDKPGYMKAISKKIGFDFVGLGWKTKWSSTDYRHEWNPLWSFVFFKWQMAIVFYPIENEYWECYLYYYYNTNKNKSIEERILQAREEFPCIWTRHNKDGEETINYWDKILKDKYL